MENKDMIPEEDVLNNDTSSTPAGDGQITESVDTLSGMPVLNSEPSDAEESVEETETTEEDKKKKQNTVLDYLHDLVFGLVAILLVFMLLFRGVVVSGSSMKNTLVDGDYIVLLSNVFYKNPQQGDIIVACKNSFRNGEPIIKRVIATEGQWIDIDFEAGIVYVDGNAIDEPYIKEPTTLSYEGMTFPLQVAEGCVFVMGDNRNDSTDSRSPSIGLIDRREIMGKAIFLVIPGTDKGFSERDYSRIGALW